MKAETKERGDEGSRGIRSLLRQMRNRLAGQLFGRMYLSPSHTLEESSGFHEVIEQVSRQDLDSLALIAESPVYEVRIRLLYIPKSGSE